MKAKNRKPLDYPTVRGRTPEHELAPELVHDDEPEVSPDLDLAIGDAPSQSLTRPIEIATLSMGGVKPLATLRQEAEDARQETSLSRRVEPPSKSRAAQAQKSDHDNSGTIYAAAAVVSVLWALSPIAFAVGYRLKVAPLQNDHFAMMVFALMAIGPAALVWFAAHMINQSARLAAETRRTRQLTQQMLTPAALAAAGAADAVAEVRTQIENAARMAKEAGERMLSLRHVLAAETAGLSEATTLSAKTSQEMTGTVSREREAMQALALALDAQSAAVTDAIGRQARMVAEASDLAETQLREAEAALTARAADLTTAAVTASDAARGGAEDISRQTARLEVASAGVVEQLREVDEGLSLQRDALTTVSDTLRAEQEDFAVQAESRAAQMAALAAQTKLEAENLGAATQQGTEALRGLIALAVDQFQQMALAAQAERRVIGDTAAKSFEALRAVAGEQRADLEEEIQAAIQNLSAAAAQARIAAQGQVDVAKSKVDQLNEAAFAAGQKANSVFESRMQEARELIEQSAIMAEQAGARSAQRLDEGVNAARAAVSEVERLLSDVSERAGSLSGEAEAQTRKVRDAVEHGMGELLASARRAAEETQAIDAAFQERVKRNYDMLSEAVSLMSADAGAAGGNSQAQRPAAPFTPLRPYEPAPPESAPAVDFAPIRAPLADDSYRPRLRLTPTTSDDDFRTVFEDDSATATPEEPLSMAVGEGSAWTWKDLLGGLSRNAPVVSAAPVAGFKDTATGNEVPDGRRLAAQVMSMGIDAASLLPRSRIDEIAAALQTGDGQGAREVVKRLAPAAIRRLVRRLFSDGSLQAEADSFLERYGTLVREASAKDRHGFLVATLLGSENGRTYLLLDAAAGDLG